MNNQYLRKKLQHPRQLSARNALRGSPVFGLLLFTLFLLCANPMSNAANATWLPPTNPDVRKIHREAGDDRRAKRYEDALAKIVWFHEHALEFEKSMAGVRLSYALSDWMDLATAYPPALQSLNAARERAELNVRENFKALDSFGDAVAINREMDQIDRNVALFKWLDTKLDKQDMRRYFVYAWPSLTEMKEYSLAGKYLDADEMLETAKGLYGVIARMPRPPGEARERLEKSFAERYRDSAANLVAVLKINGRDDDAKRIAAEAKKVLNDAEMSAMLDAALAGNAPDSLERRNREMAKTWRAEKLRLGN